ncbi:MAG: cobalamin-dependent protein [Deltaproteobacteria bacterium]|nr:cobalamin-dependent protein [Deltaproteobacteria bacterium]
MTGTGPTVERIKNAAKSRDAQVLEQCLAGAAHEGIPAMQVRDLLFGELESVRKRLMSNDTSIPEFLLTLDCVLDGLDRIRSYPGFTPRVDCTVVIGVVEGDPHDLGKNVIAGIYRACGYRVIDLGRNVPREAFTKAVRDEGAVLLALSAMMSTTMVVMRNIIRDARILTPAAKIIVGGAPLSAELARDYGADTYAESALTVIEKTEEVLAR